MAPKRGKKQNQPQKKNSLLASTTEAAASSSSKRAASSSSSKKSHQELSKDVMEVFVNELDDQLGEGSFAEVFRIKDGKMVVKLTQKTEYEAYSQFKTEVKTFRELKPNDNIVGFYGSLEKGNLAYIFLEYCPGALKEKIRGGKLDLSGIMKTLTGVAKALQHIHGQGKIHCDIKPENILIGRDEEIKIIDFGACTNTGDEANVGTLGYYLQKEDRKATEKRDIYALGTTLLQMLLLEPEVQVQMRKSKAIFIADFVRGENKPLKLVSTKVYDESTKDKAGKLVEMATRCVHQEPKGRPTLEEILAILTDCQI